MQIGVGRFSQTGPGSKVGQSKLDVRSLYFFLKIITLNSASTVTVSIAA